MGSICVIVVLLVVGVDGNGATIWGRLDTDEAFIVVMAKIYIENIECLEKWQFCKNL